MALSGWARHAASLSYNPRASASAYPWGPVVSARATAGWRGGEKVGREMGQNEVIEPIRVTTLFLFLFLI
jgi:hypothetical protein